MDGGGHTEIKLLRRGRDCQHTETKLEQDMWNFDNPSKLLKAVQAVTAVLSFYERVGRDICPEPGCEDGLRLGTLTHTVVFCELSCLIQSLVEYWKLLACEICQSDDSVVERRLNLLTITLSRSIRIAG